MYYSYDDAELAEQVDPCLSSGVAVFKKVKDRWGAGVPRV